MLLICLGNIQGKQRFGENMPEMQKWVLISGHDLPLDIPMLDMYLSEKHGRRLKLMNF